MRTLTASDIEALAIGTAILGTGGGGNPYIAKLRALQELRRGRRIMLLDLEELDDDALVLSIGGIGAPAVSIEKLEEGTEGVRVLRCLEEFLGLKIDALISAEIGGGNGLEPMMTAAAPDNASAVDDLLRHPDDKPSIGMVLPTSDGSPP